MLCKKWVASSDTKIRLFNHTAYIRLFYGLDTRRCYSLPACEVPDGCRWSADPGWNVIVLMLSEHRMDSLSINVGSSMEVSFVVRITHMRQRFTRITRRFDRFNGEPCSHDDYYVKSKNVNSGGSRIPRKEATRGGAGAYRKQFDIGPANRFPSLTLSLRSPSLPFPTFP